jgi:hypothetical protein
MATPELSQSAKLYQERRQPTHRETRRTPNTHLDLAENAVHTMDMRPPYPTIDVLHAEDYKPPEGGATTVWPHGYTEEEIT